MHEKPPLFINVKPSNLKLLFIIAIHSFAILSVFFVVNTGLIGVVLKALLLLLVAASFYRHLVCHKRNISLHFKANDQVDLNIDNKDYPDLELSANSYVSSLFLQLIFLDENMGVSHNVTIFLDSITPSMHCQLRARLKIYAGS
ncbi:MAG: hypothetical protein OQK32_07900 [Gammaproteobacteria bacterium]|nr:hypothetical protein [Gammaproteobacteria bacterium]MCW8922296.1 hypothetical protein [Gammaproteobacteria bacterium]